MMSNVLVAEDLANMILERAEADGIEEARKYYQEVMENDRLAAHRVDIDAMLIVAGKDELIVKY